MRAQRIPRRHRPGRAASAVTPSIPVPVAASAAQREAPGSDARLARAQRLGHRPAALAAPLSADRGAVQPYRDVEGGWKESEGEAIYLQGHKNLLATRSLIEASNQQLAVAGRFGSLVTLQPGEAVDLNKRRYHRVEPRLDQESFKRLTEAEPKSFHAGLKQGDEPLKIWADCRRASEAVTGSSTNMLRQDRRVLAREGEKTVLKSGSSTRLPRDVHKITTDTHTGRLSWQIYQSNLAPFVKERGIKTVFSTTALKRNFEDVKSWKKAQEKVDAAKDEILTAWKLYDSLKPEARGEFEVYSGINESALPEVGESFSIVTEYDMPGFEYKKDKEREETPWAFHWGGVILADDGDRVTLENYSVSEETKVNKKWIFEMYGSKSKEQTFHHRHLEGTVLHGTKATTLRVITEGTPREIQAYVGAVGVLSSAIGDEKAFVEASKVVTETREVLKGWYQKLEEGPPEHQKAAIWWAETQRKGADTLHQRAVKLEARYEKALKRFKELPKGERKNAVSQLGKAAKTERVRLAFASRESGDVEKLETAIRDLEKGLAGAIVEIAVDGIEKAVGGDGVDEAKQALREAYEEIGEENKKLPAVTKALERTKEILAVHRSILDYVGAVEKLAEAIATPEFEKRRKLADTAFLEIDEKYRKRPLAAKAAEAARQYGETHERVDGQIKTFLNAVKDLEAAVGTSGYGTAKSKVVEAFNEVDEEYDDRGVMHTGREKVKTLHRAHRLILAFVSSIDGAEETKDTEGYPEAKKKVLEAYKMIPEEYRNRELVTAGKVRTKKLP